MLKEKIKQIHMDTQHHPFAVLLISGKLNKEIYAELLYNYLHCYSALETECEKINLFKGIEGVQRANLIKEELQSISSKDFIPMPSTTDYENYIRDIQDKNLLMAHIYIRHLSLLSGGQQLKLTCPSKGQSYYFYDVERLISGIRAKLHEGLMEESLIAFKQVQNLFLELSEKHGIN